MAEDIISNPDPQRFAAANRDAMYRMITGAKPDDLREMVRALGGPKAVAPLVGRTERTVQRWVTRTGQQRIKAPRPAAQQALNGAFQQARSTSAGRERIAAGRRSTLMRHSGAQMHGSAIGGPLSAGRESAYVKRRNFRHHVDAGTMDATFESWIQGGDDDAFVTFNAEFGEEYGHGGVMFDEWLFTDMSGLAFGPDMSSD